MRVLIVGLLLMTGCSASKSSPGAFDSGESDGGGGSATDGGSTDTDVRDMGVYWTLDADLVVVDGVVDPAASVLHLGRRRNSSETCSDTVTPIAVVAQEELPHPSVLAWWELSWDPSTLLCFAKGEGGWNQPVLLGIGAMDPEIVAVLGHVDEVTDPLAADSLNGAYATLPGDNRLFIYGAAGPLTAWHGEGDPADGAPLPDDTWLVRTAYSFPLTL